MTTPALPAVVPAAPQLPISNETAAGAAAAQVKALVEARYMVALSRPRDMDQVREKLLKECKRPSFAEVARYNKPIGKGIIGPSIRFAEAAIRCMGNIVIDEMTVYDDPDKRIIQVSVTDLEGNVPYTTSVTIEKTVERRNKKADDVVIRERTNSYGDRVYILQAGEDEILNKKNAIISKAIRTLGLRHVPGDLIDEAMELVTKTMADRDAQDPDAARRKILDAFAALNVPIAELKKYVGHDLASMSPAEIADMRALHSAIKDGEATWKSAIEARFPDAAERASRFSKDEAPQKTEAKKGEVK